MRMVQIWWKSRKTLEKRPATQNIVRKMLSNKQETTDLSKINTHLPIFKFLLDFFDQICPKRVFPV